MIRYAWMQARLQTLVAAALLAAAAVALGVTGSHLVQAYDSTVAKCAANNNCPAVTQAFLGSDHALQTALNILSVVVPALIGLFWGAPLVARELQEGTFRLAWTQSVTRARWLAVRLAVVGLASMAAAGLFSLMVTWWYSPLDHISQSPFSSFSTRDLVPVGYAAFAFTLGVTIGMLTRWTVPAMAVSLAAFVAVRLAITYWVRPGLFTPAHQDLALNPASTGYGSSGNILFGLPASNLQPAPPDIPGAWVTSVQIVNKSGQALPSAYVTRVCPGVGGGGGGGGGGGRNPFSGGGSHTHAPANVQQTLEDCVARVGKTYHEVVSYQPGNRYWPFQWSELAIYLGIAVLLAGFCVWRIRRHPG